MYIIVIGQSGSGKTTFVKKRFLKGESEVIEDIIPLTKVGSVYLLGRYNVGIRTEGTDTLSYNAAGNIKKVLRKLKGKTVVLEGDRINNPKMLDYIATLGEPVKLYWVNCEIETSMKRLRAAGSNITETFVKATKTKSQRNYEKYKRIFSGEIINTDKRG